MVNMPFRSLHLFSCPQEKPTPQGRLKSSEMTMNFKIQFVAAVFAVVLAANCCSALGLLSGLYNPLLSGAGCGCGCGCAPPPLPPPPPPGLGLSLAHRFAISKIPSLGLGCPSTCCMVHSKPCLLTKLLLLKKKLMEKKMMMGCKHHCGCGCF